MKPLPTPQRGGNLSEGTGKTTATKYLKELVDPYTGGTILPTNNIRDFAASVPSGYIVGIDNISQINSKIVY